MKVVRISLSSREVPDHFALCVELSGCKGTCEGCHSPELRTDIGVEMSPHDIHDAAVKEYASCICLMGDSFTEKELSLLSFLAKGDKMSLAWYTGTHEEINVDTTVYFDYVKVGAYKKDLGPITSRTTNQRMYQRHKDLTYEDITWRMFE